MPTTSNVLSKPLRDKCWKSRDSYWDCVKDLARKSDGEQPDQKLVRETCGQQRKSYEADCPPVWIQLFDKKNDFELFKAKKFEENLKQSVTSSNKP